MKSQSGEQRGSPLQPCCPQVSQRTPCKATGTGSTSSFTGIGPGGFENGKNGAPRLWEQRAGAAGPGSSDLRRPSRSLRNFFRRASDMLYFKRLIQIPRLPEVPAPSGGRRRGCSLPCPCAGVGAGACGWRGGRGRGFLLVAGSTQPLSPTASAGTPQLPAGLGAGRAHQASGGDPRGGSRGRGTREPH